jgi:predicted O-methyltransferase YrrM
MRSYATIEGWFNFHALYDEQVRRARPGAVLVEVGCWLGRSLVYLAQAAQAAGKSLSIYGVEHGLGSPEHAGRVAAAGGTIVGALARNLIECGVDRTVTLIVAPSVRAAGLFAPGSVDFAFIDAGHDYASVLSDLAAWWPRVRPGGALAGHDYGDPAWPEVARAVHDFFRRTGLRSPLAPACWQVVKGGTAAVAGGVVQGPWG